MTTTTTFEKVIENIHETSAFHHDETVPVHEMEFDSLKRMWVSGKPVEVLPAPQRLLANRLKVPLTYLERCPEDLQARNLNYWIEQEQKRRATFFCRFNANRLRAVFTERYHPIDNLQILSEMVIHGFDPQTRVQYAYDDKIFVLKVPGYARTFGLKGDDKVVPGISFANSEVGIMAFNIQAYFLRLVCTNGLITETNENVRPFKW
jgi:hypothetical protein